jgi:hypothetical protein
MSKNYVRLWEKHHGKKVAPDKEIHHIDGNRKNNSPENLLEVTIEDHLKIHENQHDHGAVQAILIRMSRSAETIEKIKKAASLHQQELLRENRHNFQLPSDQRIELSKRAGEYTKQNKLGIHAINSDPILASKNGKYGRSRLSREMELKLQSEMIDKHIRGTKWWNDGIINVRSKECPGQNFKRGMKNGS